MRILIEIPKEFEGDYRQDRFKEFFERVLEDIKTHMDSDIEACGLYEKETAEMFINAFSDSQRIDHREREFET